MDLTPKYAGILMGMSNGFAATGGLGGPLIVAYIVKDMVRRMDLIPRHYSLKQNQSISM